MEILHRTDIALFGVLSGSQGYTRGEFFLIDSPNPTIKEFIKISTHAKAFARLSTSSPATTTSWACLRKNPPSKRPGGTR